MSKPSVKLKRARLRNFAKMRVSAASTLSSMVMQKEYKDVFYPIERDQIQHACAILDVVLRNWRKR